MRKSPAGADPTTKKDVPRLGAVEKAMLRIVRENGPLRATTAGEYMWPESAYNPAAARSLARPAAKILRRLEARGLVRVERHRWGAYWKVS